MNNKKTITKCAVSAIVGFAIGILVIPPTVFDAMDAGDISKVNKFQKNSVSPQVSAFQERMLNNPEELNNQVALLVVLNSRLNDFNNLISMTSKVAEGRNELAETATSLKNLSSLSENARQSSREALISFDELLDKNAKPSHAYDQASQNASLAFLMVERQVSCGKDFVAAADEYLKKKGIDGNEDVALARDLWQDFCQVDAVMNSDKEELAYWAGVDRALSDSKLGTNHKPLLGNEKISNELKSLCATAAINQAILVANNTSINNDFSILSGFCLNVNSENAFLYNQSPLAACNITIDNLPALCQNPALNAIESFSNAVINNGNVQIGNKDNLLNAVELVKNNEAFQNMVNVLNLRIAGINNYNIINNIASIGFDVSKMGLTILY